MTTENQETTDQRGDSSVESTDLFCPCVSWCRSEMSPYPGRSRDGIPLVTNHHPRCDLYNDSLIDVWRVSYDGAWYHTDLPPTADELTGEETVTQEKMHRECYDQLPEFEGF